jgi:hypothetical protein
LAFSLNGSLAAMASKITFVSARTFIAS